MPPRDRRECDEHKEVLKSLTIRVGNLEKWQEVSKAMSKWNTAIVAGLASMVGSGVTALIVAIIMAKIQGH